MCDRSGSLSHNKLHPSSAKSIANLGVQMAVTVKIMGKVDQLFEGLFSLMDEFRLTTWDGAKTLSIMG